MIRGKNTLSILGRGLHSSPHASKGQNSPGPLFYDWLSTLSKHTFQSGIHISMYKVLYQVIDIPFMYITAWTIDTINLNTPILLFHNSRVAPALCHGRGPVYSHGRIESTTYCVYT
jgi:hypothetical protein